jgi:MFS family permease
VLFRHRAFQRYFLARCCSEFGYQIVVVAIGWQVYALTHSALALGLVGLAGFVPNAVLTFVAGHVADRYDRRRIVQCGQFVEALTGGVLAWGSFAGWLTVSEIYVAVVVLGCASAFEGPAESALLPAVVPQDMLQRGAAIVGGTWQSAAIGGPALGGIAYAVAPGVPYAALGVLMFVALLLNGWIPLVRVVREGEPASWKTLFAGVGFVRSQPSILGTISLDLFAVLLGGATALLPIYARDILHTGPWGLGLLRGAPAVGALAMTAFLAHRPLAGRAGLRMFQGVIVFGAATIVFALSHQFWLSLAALFVMGAGDTISVVVRTSLVQLLTPDTMRGRVSAVNGLFINASSQLGEFESGVTAALLGAVPAAALGGLGTIVVAVLWMRLFPALRAVDRLEG